MGPAITTSTTTTTATTPALSYSVEHAEAVANWFEACNGAQQAALAVKLLSRANPKALHLVHGFLQQRLHVTSAIWRQEVQRSNDPAFLNGLRNEPRDVAVSQLLHYLPLLRPANSEGVRSYINLLPSLLASFLEEEPGQVSDQQQQQQQHQSTEIQQLLTYALIHPALSLESKRSLAALIRQLDDDGSQEVPLAMLDNRQSGLVDMFPEHGAHWDPWSSPSAGLGPPPSASAAGQTAMSAAATAASQRIRRSNSLTPPSNSVAFNAQDPWAATSDNGRMKPRSLSLSSPGETVNGLSHCPLSPQNSLASSGSGSGSDTIYSDENQRPSSFQIPGSGMKDVPSWLKSLRLHKYSHLFSLLTYDEMLALTEEQLELQGVTKGARHKIALSIQRLRERPNLISQLEKEVVDSGNLHNALNELKNMLSTPIKPYRAPAGAGSVDAEQLYVNNSLSPSPSPLMTRDDTSGYSSLDGSMDNLSTSRTPTSVLADVPTALDLTLSKIPPPPAKASSPLSLSPHTKSSSSVVDVMPTVIVSAAPDVDSAEEGSDTSADDGLGDALSGSFRSAFGGELELGPSVLAHDDLPGQMTRLLGKICTQLLVSASPAEDSVSQFVTLLDRCLNHEAFTQRQRRRIASWKEQAHRVWNTLPSTPGCGGNVSGAPNGGRNGPGGPNNSAGQQKGVNDSRSFGRRWSNVAHYPGFYNAANDPTTTLTGAAFAPSSSYSLFPPRQPQRGIHSASPCPSPSRPLFQQGPTHNSYGQHTHHASAGPNASSMRTPMTAPLTHNPPHSLQVGSHLPIQHRNSFCVSALTSSAAGSSLYAPQSYAPTGHFAAPDPFAFATHRTPHFEDLTSTSESFASRLGIQRARSAPMANGGLFGQERDASEMDLNHRLESLCLSMTEHALEGANDN